MPKLTKRVPKYRLHKASGQAVVTLGGHDHYLGPHDSPESQIKYDRLVAEWLATGRESPRAPAPRLLMQDLLAAFWTHAESYYRQPNGEPTSEVGSFRQVLRVLRGLYAEFPLSDFGPHEYKTVRDQMVRRGYVRTSVEQRMGRVKRIFRWGVEHGYVQPETVQALECVASLKMNRSEAPESSPVTPVADEVIDATLPHVTPPVAAMIRLQRLTGMRPGEATLLRPADLDRSQEVWIYRPAQHKNGWRGNSREICVGPRAQQILTPFLDRHEDDYCFSPAEAMRYVRNQRRSARQTPITPSQNARTRASKPQKTPRKRYDVGSYGQAIARACKKAGVDRWSPNQIRHRYGTDVRAEYGLEAAQATLGHKRADVTQIYAERDATLAQRIAVQKG